MGNIRTLSYVLLLEICSNPQHCRRDIFVWNKPHGDDDDDDDDDDKRARWQNCILKLAEHM